MKKYNKRVDVIIPAYNVPDNILHRCLASISIQLNIDDIDVTIVDDASETENYETVAKAFSDYMNVKVVKCDANGGPGVARQIGINNTVNGFITFIDADDTFANAYSIPALVDGMSSGNTKFCMCVGCFDEIHSRPDDIVENSAPFYFMEHSNDMVWVFGKMYRRSYLDENKICFHKTSRANEDNGFNTIFRLTSNQQYPINFIPYHVYYWMETDNSITRANDCQYSYGSSMRDSFYGYTENMIYAIKEAKRINPYNGAIDKFATDVMLQLYAYYIECVNKAPEHAKTNYSYVLWYYREIFSYIRHKISNEMLAIQYSEIIKNAYLGNKFAGIIPEIGIYEFLDKLESEVK